MIRLSLIVLVIVALSSPAASCPWDFAQFNWFSNSCCVKLTDDSGSVATGTAGCDPCEVDINLVLDAAGAQPGCRVRAYSGFGNPAWSTGVPVSMSVEGSTSCNSAVRVEIQTDSNNDNIADCAIYAFSGICGGCGE